MGGGVAEPDFELVNAALDDVALLIDLGVELWWSCALACATETVGWLAAAFGYGLREPIRTDQPNPQR